MITLAELTNTAPPSTVIVTLPPFTVLSVVLVNKLLYPTVPCTTWYVRMDVSAVVEIFDSAEPIAANAALLGAKMVTSLSPSTVERRPVELRALARVVRFAARAVLEGASGMVRTVSMMWITPPLNFTSCGDC